MALVIVRSEPGITGTITIKAKSPGLKDAVAEVKSKDYDPCSGFLLTGTRWFLKVDLFDGLFK